MIYAVAADAIVALHLAFIVLVAVGGFFVLIWPRLALAHVPAALWGAYVSLSGRICPLTPLEQYFRQAAGQRGYSGGFIDHYLLPIIYPAGLDRSTQIALGVLVIALNLVLYGVLWYRLRMRQRTRRALH